MNIKLKNLGPIKQADFTVGDFTIICGRNNTGKTYVTYATYGYLDYFHNNLDAITYGTPEEDTSAILQADSAQQTYSINLKNTINLLADSYSKLISNTFAGKKSAFAESRLSVIGPFNFNASKPFLSKKHFTHSGDQISVEMSCKDTDGNFSICASKRITDPLDWVIADKAILEVIRDSIFKGFVPRPFIVSAERTGASLFQREVDFTRSKLIDLLKDPSVDSQAILGRFTADYPVPVKHNVDFVRDLPNIVKKESIFAKQHPEVLETFSEILGGNYTVNQTGAIEYTPSNNPKISLSLAESSSTVRSLVNIGFYLRHVAQPDDLLMVDEPELNLHPQNQRKVARLFAMLVNHGIRVFITTHSDYIIRELNTLLLLNKQDDDRLHEVMKREGYAKEELLKPEQLKIYMTTEDKKNKHSFTLTQANITDESGIELTTFDDTINDMNRIQDEIIWG